MLYRQGARRAVMASRGLATVKPVSASPVLLEDLPRSQTTGQARSRLPSFTMSRSRGFLPRDDPLVSLPHNVAAFQNVESLLERMTLVQPDGKPGLLALGEFGQEVHRHLCTGADAKDLEKAVDEAIATGDQDLISALFRDLSFLVSAYLLEPVDLHFKATGTYCAGRDVLPAGVAVPFKKLADALGHFPFMEYASSYALQNWRRLDANAPIEYDNLRLIRAFENRAPESSESGFILVHVDMVAHTGALLSQAERVLATAETRNMAEFKASMEALYRVYQSINMSMDTMWGRSKPADYLKFRSFIFGTGPGKRLNAMFPNGVIYESVSDEPTFFRGESGANDSIIPIADNILEITAHLPNNELTRILRDFRSYRPRTQREYVESVEQRASSAGVRAFAQSDPAALGLYVLMVDQVREFRDRHWRFTKSYILDRTSYNIATGGSPIATYLPSNLATVLEVLTESCADLSPSALKSSGLDQDLQTAVEACRERGQVQRRALDREVAKFVQAQEVRKGAAMGALEPGEVTSKTDGAKFPQAVVKEKPLQRGPVGCDGVG